MSLRTTAARRRATRPVLEGLETRELLSTVHVIPTHPGAEISASRASQRHGVPTISQLPTTPSTTVSTIPANGDQNPYGVTFISRDFARGGMLQAGDVLVSNFNNAANLQGTGTTIVRVGAGNQTSVFYQGPPGVGFSNGLGTLKRGFVIAGFVPSTDGTPNTVGQGGLLILDRNGNRVATFTDPSLANGPWGLTVNDGGDHAQVYVANVLSGTVTRFDLSIPARGNNIKLLAATQIASGYTHHGDPAAFEIGPAGLVYEKGSGTLFVASTGDNAIYAISNAAHRRSDGGTGRIVYNDPTHLHGPIGLAVAPDGNFITANGDGVNADPNQPSELVEFTRRGQFVGQFSIDPTAGAAFAVAFSAAPHVQFAAVDDVTGTVRLWPIR